MAEAGGHMLSQSDRHLLIVVLAVFCLLGPASELSPPINAQTQDIGEGQRPHDVITRLKQGWHRFCQLNTTIDLKGLPRETTFKDAIELLCEKLEEQKI